MAYTDTRVVVPLAGSPDPTSPETSGSAALGTITAGTPLQKRNIRWTFDRDVEYGAFANGDVYIVYTAGLQIDTIEYLSGTWQNGGGNRSGTEVNTLISLNDNGFGVTSTNNTYDPALNVALNLPYSCSAGQSFISASPQPNPNVDPYKTSIADMEVLTVLGSHATFGDFRPTVYGSNKTINYNKSQINYNVLGSMTDLSGGPSFADCERLTERIWYSGHDSWYERYIRPHQNWDDYGNTWEEGVQAAYIKLNCNYTNAEKEQLAINICQQGIDFAGMVDTGASWPADGGIFGGRKMPMFLAGAMLGDTALRDKSTNFGEIQQTFYVSAADLAGGSAKGDYLDPVFSGTNAQANAPGTTLTQTEVSFDVANMTVGRIIRNTTTGESAIVTGRSSSTTITHTTLPSGWTAGDNWELTELGMAEWGIRHAQTGNPLQDQRAWNIPYRTSDTAGGWFGQALAVEVMGLKAAYGHNPFFDYVERYSRISAPQTGDWIVVPSSTWVNSMYDNNHVFPT